MNEYDYRKQVDHLICDQVENAKDAGEQEHFMQVREWFRDEQQMPLVQAGCEGKYVLYYCEHMRDGVEEGAKVLSSLEACVAKINDGNWWPRENYEFRVFKLGEEVPLETFEQEEPQPSKRMTKYKAK